MRTRALREACAAAATIAAALTLCVTAAPAAADTVGNPGSFVAGFSGWVSLGGSPLAGFDEATTPFTVGGSVDQDGVITGASTNTWPNSNTLSPATSLGTGGGGLSFELNHQQLTLHSGAVSGTVDPASGATTLSINVYGTLTANLDYSIANVTSGSSTLNCTVGSADSPITIPLSSSGSVSPPMGPSPVAGVPYDPATGTVTLVSGAFTSPDPSCNGASLLPDAESVFNQIRQELIGSSGAGTVWLGGTFSPALTAPAPPPPPPPPAPPPGPGSSTGQQSGGGQQSNTQPAAKCVVPKLGHASLHDARKKLSAAHCKPGKVKKRHSTKVKTGHLISQGSKPGAKLANGSAVALTVSSGKPRPRHRHH